jgi:hypothetical protein
MKLGDINTILALLILISISVLCHLQQWIPSTSVSMFNDINKFSRLGCPYYQGKCAKEECSVIKAQLPLDLVRGCGEDTSPSNFEISPEDLQKIISRLHLANVNYVMLNKKY